MSKEHFIKNIEIKNFKCFEDFKAEGFGRVNLIGGKNNVGKTAFMEALFFNVSIDGSSFIPFLEALISLEYFRNNKIADKLDELDINQYIKLLASFLKKYINTFISTNKNYIKIDYDKNLIIKLNDKKYGLSDFNPLNINTNIEFSTKFISSLFIEDEQLSALYDGVKFLRKREEINKFIEKFDSDILEYEFIDNEPFCFSKKENKFILLSEYSNGMKRYISYVCALWANKDSYIFIDEIENGIHYTNLDKLWEIILKTSKEANCQVFATTHSKECIESFNRVQKELNDKDTYYFEMAKNKKTDKIFMTQIDSEQLEYGLSHNERIRGE